jgi:tetratricopeptide (TPR) repeat protein
MILLTALLAIGSWGRATESVQELVRRAREAHAAGHLKEAAQLYESALRVRPHLGAAEYGLGLIASVRKNYAQAVYLFSEALSDDPTLADAYLFRGIALFNLHQINQSLTSLKRFYQLRPGDQQVRFFLAAAYNAQGNYSKAAEFYLKQLQITPANAKGWYYLGECLLNLARRELPPLQVRKGKYLLWMIYARDQADKGQVSGAELDLREAIKIGPMNPEAHVSLGNLLLSEGKNARAKIQFREALATVPLNCRALEGVGDVELAEGNILGSLSAYELVATAKGTCLEEPVPVDLGLSPAEFSARVKSLSKYTGSAKWKWAATFELSRLTGQDPCERFRLIQSSNTPPRHALSDNTAVESARRRAIYRSRKLHSPYKSLFEASCLESRGDLRGAVEVLSTPHTGPFAFTCGLPEKYSRNWNRSPPIHTS